MLCEQIMKRDMEFLATNDTVVTAARKMRDANVGFLPVRDQAGKPLGTLTDRDIVLRFVAEARPATTLVTDVMTKELITCRPKDDLHQAEQLMGKSHKSRLLCVDDAGKLVGVLSLSDIAQHEDSALVGQTIRQVTEREAHVH